MSQLVKRAHSKRRRGLLFQFLLHPMGRGGRGRPAVYLANLKFRNVLQSSRSHYYSHIKKSNKYSKKKKGLLGESASIGIEHGLPRYRSRFNQMKHAILNSKVKSNSNLVPDITCNHIGLRRMCLRIDWLGSSGHKSPSGLRSVHHYNTDCWTCTNLYCIERLFYSTNRVPLCHQY